MSLASNIELTLSAATLAGLVFTAGGGWYMLQDLRTRVDTLINQSREDHDRATDHAARLTLLERQYQEKTGDSAKLH